MIFLLLSEKSEGTTYFAIVKKKKKMSGFHPRALGQLVWFILFSLGFFQ